MPNVKLYLLGFLIGCYVIDFVCLARELTPSPQPSPPRGDGVV